MSDLRSITRGDLRRISTHSFQLLIELDNLIERSRIEVAPKSAKSPIPHTPRTNLTGQTRQPPARRAPQTTSPTRKKVRHCWSAHIFIPDNLRGASLPTFREVSLRLANILLYRGFKTLGDLHGLQFSEFLRLRNCGKRTVLELETFVSGIQDGTSSDRFHQPAFNERAGPYILSIAPSVRDLKLLELPLSVRAVDVLEKMGAQRLGDLEGVTTHELRVQRNCGKKTLLEIRALVWRANSGEFDFAPENPQEPSPFDLLSKMDEMLSQLPKRKLECMTLRLGANERPPCTLETIATKLGITSEAVRMGVRRTLEALLRHIGPRGNAALDWIAKTCHDSVCPLTPDLLTDWVPTPWTLRYNPTFYIRAIAGMRSDIPGWPDGQKTLRRAQRAP